MSKQIVFLVVPSFVRFIGLKRKGRVNRIPVGAEMNVSGLFLIFRVFAMFFPIILSSLNYHIYN